MRRLETGNFSEIKFLNAGLHPRLPRCGQLGQGTGMDTLSTLPPPGAQLNRIFGAEWLDESTRSTAQRDFEAEWRIKPLPGAKQRRDLPKT